MKVDITIFMRKLILCLKSHSGCIVSVELGFRERIVVGEQDTGKAADSRMRTVAEYSHFVKYVI